MYPFARVQMYLRVQMYPLGNVQSSKAHTFVPVKQANIKRLGKKTKEDMANRQAETGLVDRRRQDKQTGRDRASRETKTGQTVRKRQDY